MQHPTRRFLEPPSFDSLRRWTRWASLTDVPLSATIGAMDEMYLSSNTRRIFKLDRDRAR